MKKLLIVPCCLFILNCYSQDNRSLQDQTLDVLRDFRDTLSRSQKNSSRDSLLDMTNTLIDVSKSLNDAVQLRNLRDYYSIAEVYYNSTPSDGKEVFFTNFNKDLKLKFLHTGGRNLQLENINSLFQNYN